MDNPGGAIWGKIQLQVGEPRRVQIGPLLLNLQRLVGEWRVAREQSHTNGEGVGIPQLDDEPMDMLNLEGMERFAVSGADGAITVLPVLADRPVVARPEHPFHLPAGEEVNVFVSTPLWARILMGEQPFVIGDYIRVEDTTGVAPQSSAPTNRSQKEFERVQLFLSFMWLISCWNSRIVEFCFCLVAQMEVGHFHRGEAQSNRINREPIKRGTCTVSVRDVCVRCTGTFSRLAASAGAPPPARPVAPRGGPFRCSQ